MIGQQMPFNELLSHLSDSRKSVGVAGEILLAQRLEQQGYEIAANHKWKRGDLQVFLADGNARYVEVKTARQGNDKKWRFCLYKNDKYGATDHRRTDFVVLMCIMKSGAAIPFVVPTSEVRNQHYIVISSNPRTYAGKFSAYRQKLSELKIN